MEEVGKILPRVLKQHVQGERAPVLDVLAGLWPSVAGKCLAGQARPFGFREGTLTLVTSSESWAIELRGLREEIRAAVNSALGRPLVKQVRVRLTPDLGSELGDAETRPEIFLECQPQLTGWPETGPVSGLDGLDPEIRAVMARSFAKYFGRTPPRCIRVNG
ncbi:MAG TPA: DUF721 domain-containing protein [Terriglobia bacterium]